MTFIVDIANSSKTESFDLTVLEWRRVTSIKSPSCFPGRIKTTEYPNGPAGIDSARTEDRRALKPQLSFEATRCYEKLFGRIPEIVMLTGMCTPLFAYTAASVPSISGRPKRANHSSIARDRRVSHPCLTTTYSPDSCRLYLDSGPTDRRRTQASSQSTFEVFQCPRARQSCQ